MGLDQSRPNDGTPEAEQTGTNAYRYPPKSGSYFGSHFFMGGERFETMKPDVYLFGDNEDLNFLGNKPSPFPHPFPHPGEPTKTLKSLVNIRKDSLKLIKESEESRTKDSTSSDSPGESEHLSSNTGTTTSPSYNIEFTFDTDVKCAITIYYFATEEIVNKQAVYTPKDAKMNSETFHYKRGINQIFCQPTHVIDPSKYPETQWQYNFSKEVIPIVIQCVVEEEEYAGHSHMTFAIVDKTAEGSYVIKALKQKQMVDGLCYLLQEIYGIENKNTESVKPDDEIEDTGSECVICMCETRDTIILPCRHLCLCNGCADNLRYQANNCPICRAKFRALLQIRAIQKRKTHPVTGAVRGGVIMPRQRDLSSGDVEGATPVSQDGVPQGYEAVSLVEALNGPTLPHRARQVPTTFTSDVTLQSVFCDGAITSNNATGTDVKTDQKQQQQPQQHVSKKATLATSENDVISSSSASSISSKTKSRSSAADRFDEDEPISDLGDVSNPSMCHSRKEAARRLMTDEDVTSSSVQVLNSPVDEEEEDRCDSSSVLPVSIRSSMANTSMDSELVSNSDSDLCLPIHSDVTPLHATRIHVDPPAFQPKESIGHGESDLPLSICAITLDSSLPMIVYDNDKGARAPPAVSTVGSKIRIAAADYLEDFDEV